MFDGNVIYEMNPVGEINIPHEEKAPNMNDDGKGKISIATGGSSGGGVRLFNFEHINTTEEKIEFIVHGATLNDIRSVIMLNGVFEEGMQPKTVPYGYFKQDFDPEQLVPLFGEDFLTTFYIDDEYLDGVKIYAEVSSPL